MSRSRTVHAGLAISAALALGAGAAVAVGGCGGGATATTATTDGGPIASAPSALPPPSDATGPETTPTAARTETDAAPTGTEPGAQTTSTEDDGGAVPGGFVTTITHTGTRLTPAEITVPPFVAVRLSLTSGDGRPHRITVATPDGPVSVRVSGTGAASVTIPGLPRGSYRITGDGAVRATLTAGNE